MAETRDNTKDEKPDEDSLAVAEAVQLAYQSLEMSHPSFKDCDIILLTVTKGNSFDMVGNASPPMMLEMLRFGMHKVLSGGAMEVHPNPTKAN